MSGAPVSKKAKTEEAAAAPAELAEGETNQNWCWSAQLNVDNDWLKSEMEAFGEVTSARVQLDRTSRQSRGFGYDDFYRAAAAAKKAFEEVRARRWTGPCHPHRPIHPQGDVTENPPRSSTTSDRSLDTLFIGNLSFDITEDDVWNAFSEHVEVSGVRLPKDPDSVAPKGFGYVRFASQESAQTAIDAMEWSGACAGRPLRLDFSTPRDRDGGAPRVEDVVEDSAVDVAVEAVVEDVAVLVTVADVVAVVVETRWRTWWPRWLVPRYPPRRRRGQRGGSARTGGAADFSGKKMTFERLSLSPRISFLFYPHS